ncbi:MAG: thiol:disulfide interchange protein DsbA/DsbL [Pseudomonadota bacterium]
MRVFLAATLTVALAACGSSEPETTAAPVTDTAADAPVAEQAPAETEAAPVLAAVEESDGSYDPEAVAEEGALRMARDDTPAVPQRFKEGVHYKRFRPAKLTVEGGPTVEVAEVFWYGCNHCYNLEPVLRRWDDNKPENASFVKVPAMWNDVLKVHAQAFYTIEALAGSGLIENKDAVHMAFFDKMHVENQRMTSERSIREFLENFGVSEQDFENTWTSPWVKTRINQAERINRSYGIASVPTIVVNGKFITDEGMAGSKPELVAVIDELVASER